MVDYHLLRVKQVAIIIPQTFFLNFTVRKCLVVMNICVIRPYFFEENRQTITVTVACYLLILDRILILELEIKHTISQLQLMVPAKWSNLMLTDNIVIDCQRVKFPQHIL